MVWWCGGEVDGSPALGSWQYLALIAHRHLNSEWYMYTSAMLDLARVLPGARFVPTQNASLPYLSCTGWWSDEGEWIPMHEYSLPCNVNGLRYFPRLTTTSETDAKNIERHINRIKDLLKTELHREDWSALYRSTVEASTSSSASKLSLPALRLQAPGPALNATLDAIPLPLHRSAMSFFFSADFFLATSMRAITLPGICCQGPRHIIRRLQRLVLKRTRYVYHAATIGDK